MQSAEGISFHDSGIVSVRRDRGSLILELEDVTVKDGMRHATVRFEGIQTITCDGKLVDDLVPVFEDGEVWTLERTADTVHLLVGWMDFNTRKSETHSYRISCDSFHVEIH